MLPRMLPRFVLYGCAGWVLEVGFTGLSAALWSRDTQGTAKTYLWMHPIYGATALGLELLHDRMSALPRPVRALAYTVVIFGAEFASGWLLRRLLGRCPWDYGRRRWSVKGLIRLDYAPFWYGAALLFEPAREAFLRGTSEALRQTPEYRHALEAGTVAEPLPLTPVSDAQTAGDAANTFLLATEPEQAIAS